MTLNSISRFFPTSLFLCPYFYQIEGYGHRYVTTECPEAVFMLCLQRWVDRSLKNKIMKNWCNSFSLMATILMMNFVSVFSFVLETTKQNPTTVLWEYLFKLWVLTIWYPPSLFKLLNFDDANRYLKIYHSYFLFLFLFHSISWHQQTVYGWRCVR